MGVGAFVRFWGRQRITASPYIVTYFTNNPHPLALRRPIMNMICIKKSRATPESRGFLSDHATADLR